MCWVERMTWRTLTLWSFPTNARTHSHAYHSIPRIQHSICMHRYSIHNTGIRCGRTHSIIHAGCGIAWTMFMDSLSVGLAASALAESMHHALHIISRMPSMATEKAATLSNSFFLVVVFCILFFFFCTISLILYFSWNRRATIYNCTVHTCNHHAH